MDPETIKLIARLLAGLQVPRSMGMLGEATEPYDKLRDMYGCFGWLDADEHERLIEKALGAKA